MKFGELNIDSLFIKRVAHFFLTLAQLLPFLVALSTVFVVRHDMANGVTSGKYWWFCVAMVSVVAGATLFGFFFSWRLRLCRIDVVVFLFCLCGFAVTLASGGSGSNKLIHLALLLLLYFYFRFYLSSRHGREGGRYLLLFFLVTGLVESWWGLGQLYGFWVSQHGQFKLTGSFFNPGPYAGYLAMVAPCALYYLRCDYRVLTKPLHRRYRFFYLRWAIAALTCASILPVLPATMSRAAWVAVVGGCGLSWYFWHGNRNKKSGRRSSVKRAAGMLGLLAVVVACATGAYHLKKDSADGRLLIWKIAVQTAAKYPLGVGLDHFSGAYGEEQAAYFASGQGSEQEQQVAGSPEYGFNEYLQMCVELGVAPFLLFVGVIVLTFRRGIRKRCYAVLVALCSLLLFAGMSYPFSVLPFAIVLVLLVALCASEHVSGGRRPQSAKASRGLLIVLLIATFACLSSRRASIQAYRSWQEAQMLYNASLHQAAVEEYAKLYEALRYEIRFLFEYAQSLNKSGNYEASNRVLHQAVRISCDPMLYNVAGRNCQALGEYAAAEKYLWQAVHIVPSRLYPYYLLAKLYAEMGLHGKAQEMAAVVHTKKPKVDSQAVREMREELKMVNSEQAAPTI
jgi:Ca2+/Na+ antiporter